MGASGAGQLAKMVNQICIAGLVQGLSEAIAFGQQAGLDMNQVLDVIGKGAAQSWQMDNRGKTMVAGRSTSALPWTGCARTWAWCWTRPSATRAPAGHRAGRPVLRRRAAHGRRALGHSSLIKRLK
jgi:3-hydroxyisobutyrate dehydrogenase-like beta-hydroxyacid dehydrogenase